MRSVKWHLLGLLGLAACGVDARDKPVPPDMMSLVEAYDSPTRSFDETTALELQSLLEAKLKPLTDLGSLAERLEETLAAVDEDMPRTRSGRMPVDFTGDGFARVERICTGHGDPSPPVDKDANGFLQLTVGYTEDGIDPVIFGGAFTCAEQIADRRMELAGAIDLYVGNALKLSDVPTTPVLFRLSDFAFTVNDVELVSGGFDFQVCRGTASRCVAGYVEMLLALPEGGTIVFFINSATGAGGFRAANGIWTCAFRDGMCTDEQGHVVKTPVYEL
jgi:hypothetical protein